MDNAREEGHFETGFVGGASAIQSYFKVTFGSGGALLAETLSGRRGCVELTSASSRSSTRLTQSLLLHARSNRGSDAIHPVVGLQVCLRFFARHKFTLTTRVRLSHRPC